MQNPYMLFEHKCVLAVHVHNHPIMIKIHPVIFLNPQKIIITFSDQAIHRFLANGHHTGQVVVFWAYLKKKNVAC